MWHLRNHSVGESLNVSVISALSFAAYATAPNTPDASLHFNERRECEEKGWVKGVDSRT